MDVVTRYQRRQDEGARVDMTARYALSADVPLIVRTPDTVQIGAEEPRRVLLLNAPPEAAPVLAGLDGSAPVGAVLAAHDADPLVWHTLLQQLLSADLLVTVVGESGPSPGSGHLSQERIGLMHRHGPAAAGRILQARRDALVVVRGDSAASSLVATLIAAAGVGHVHHDPTRTWLTVVDRRFGRHGGPDERRRSGPAADTAVRAANPSVRTHRPAPHQTPAVVVLAGDAVPDLGLAATLVQERLPHLSVLTLAGRAVIGPLVLPGRSSCLGCMHRHRVDADPGWPTVARTLARQAPRAPVTISAMAAAFAAGQILDLVDGTDTPITVNGSIEWTAEGLSGRRRSWPEHPDCGCRLPR
jgi:hypothetical protein